MLLRILQGYGTKIEKSTVNICLCHHGHWEFWWSGVCKIETQESNDTIPGPPGQSMKQVSVRGWSLIMEVKGTGEDWGIQPNLPQGLKQDRSVCGSTQQVHLSPTSCPIGALEELDGAPRCCWESSPLTLLLSSGSIFTDTPRNNILSVLTQSSWQMKLTTMNTHLHSLSQITGDYPSKSMAPHLPPHSFLPSFCYSFIVFQWIHTYLSLLKRR